MTAQLNHTIVWCRDQQVAATFLSDVLGLPDPTQFGPFEVVEAGNGVSLDFHETYADITSQHYAFLVGEDDFDRSFALIQQRVVDHWADPACTQPNEINHNDGGRGVYFTDPDGHLLEIITRPYGSGG